MASSGVITQPTKVPDSARARASEASRREKGGTRCEYCPWCLRARIGGLSHDGLTMKMNRRATERDSELPHKLTLLKIDSAGRASIPDCKQCATVQKTFDRVSAPPAIYYGHCGSAGDERTLTLRHQGQRYLFLVSLATLPSRPTRTETRRRSRVGLHRTPSETRAWRAVISPNHAKPKRLAFVAAAVQSRRRARQEPKSPQVATRLFF